MKDTANLKEAPLPRQAWLEHGWSYWQLTLVLLLLQLPGWFQLVQGIFARKPASFSSFPIALLVTAFASILVSTLVSWAYLRSSSFLRVFLLLPALLSPLLQQSSLQYALTLDLVTLWLLSITLLLNWPSKGKPFKEWRFNFALPPSFWALYRISLGTSFLMTWMLNELSELSMENLVSISLLFALTLIAAGLISWYRLSLSKAVEAQTKQSQFLEPLQRESWQIEVLALEAWQIKLFSLESHLNRYLPFISAVWLVTRPSPFLETPLWLFAALILSWNLRLWPSKRAQKASREWIFFDAECGLCQRAVYWLLAEDLRSSPFFFATQRGERFQQLKIQHNAEREGVYLLCEGGRLLVAEQAFIYILESLGGGWRALAWLLARLPYLRLIYDGLIIHRHYWSLLEKNFSSSTIPKAFTHRFDWQ